MKIYNENSLKLSLLAKMHHHILPTELEKYVLVDEVDPNIRWDVESLDLKVFDIPLSFYYVNAGNFMGMLTISSYETNNFYRSLLDENLSVEKLGTREYFCDLFDFCPYGDAASYRILHNYHRDYVCECCYRDFNVLRDKIVIRRIGDLIIFSEDTDKCTMKIKNGPCVQLVSYPVDTINMYHPKLININPLWSCYVCGNGEDVGDVGDLCWCSRFVSQIFSKFYFPISNLIPFITRFEDLYLPSDIVNLIHSLFMDVCMNYNYTDNNLLFIDEKKLKKDGDWATYMEKVD